MPSPADLPDPGIELESPALQDSLPTEPSGRYRIEQSICIHVDTAVYTSAHTHTYIQAALLTMGTINQPSSPLNLATPKHFSKEGLVLKLEAIVKYLPWFEFFFSILTSLAVPGLGRGVQDLSLWHTDSIVVLHGIYSCSAQASECPGSLVVGCGLSRPVIVGS